MPVSWNAGTYYTPNNIVLYVPNGLSYIASALSPNINRIPPSSATYWTLYTGGGGGGSISLISGGANINVSGGVGPIATISVNDPFIDGTIQTSQLQLGSGSGEGEIDFYSTESERAYKTFALNDSSVITSSNPILDCGLTLNASSGIYLGSDNTLIQSIADVYNSAIGCYTALEYPTDILRYEAGGIAAGYFTKAVGFVPDNTSSMPFFPTPDGVGNPTILTDSVEVVAGGVSIPALVAGVPLNNSFNITQIDRSVRWWRLNVSISWTALWSGGITPITGYGTLLGIVPSIILNTDGGTATYNGSQYTSTTPANLQIFDYGSGGYGYGSLTFTDYININQDFVATDGPRTLTAGLSLKVNNNSTGAQTILLGTNGLKVSYSLEACFAP